MIVTFSKAYAASHSLGPRWGMIEQATDAISACEYGRNLLAQKTWEKGRRVSFTIQTRDAYAYGSRTAASGRHMPKASWEAHRDVMAAIFSMDPDARIKAGRTTYEGRKHFHDTFEETGDWNVGSNARPVTLRSCSIPKEGHDRK